MPNDSRLITTTLKTSRIIFVGIATQATLFAFWGRQFFLMDGTPSTGGIGIYFIFGGMAVLSFAYGIRFFQNYTKVKRDSLLKMVPKRRKETLLLISAIHHLLLEFVAIVGIMLALFVQNTNVIYPFFALFAIGMGFSFPKKTWFEGFLEEAPHGTSTV